MTSPSVWRHPNITRDLKILISHPFSNPKLNKRATMQTTEKHQTKPNTLSDGVDFLIFIIEGLRNDFVDSKGNNVKIAKTILTPVLICQVNHFSLVSDCEFWSIVENIRCSTGKCHDKEKAPHPVISLQREIRKQKHIRSWDGGEKKEKKRQSQKLTVARLCRLILSAIEG